MRPVRRFLQVALLALFLAALALPPAATAQRAPAGSPMVAGSVIRDFARVTFYWPEPVRSFDANVSGTMLTVRFDRSVNPNFGEILRSLHPYVTKAELAGDQRTIRLTLNNSYKIRTFITDSETGVDILGISKTSKPAPRPEPETQQAEPTQQKPAAQPVTTQQTAQAALPPRLPWKTAPLPQARPALPKPPQQPTPPVKVVTTTQGDTPADATTSATVTEKTEAKPGTPPPTPPVEAPKPAPKEAIPAETPPPAPAPETPKPAEAPATAPATAAPVVEVAEKPVAPPVSAPAPVQTALPALPTEPVSALLKKGIPAPQPVTGEAMMVMLGVVNKQPVLTFPFTDRVAAAVWMRGRTAWILFNKPRSLTGLKEIIRDSQGWLAGIQQYGAADHTLLRLDMLTDLYVKAEKDAEGYNWKIVVSSSPVFPTSPLPALVKKDGGEKGVFIEASETAGPYTVYDAQQGDTLRVVATFASGTAISPGRNFVDFNLPGTVQGIVVEPLADGIRVTRNDHGVLIGSQAGLLLSPELEKTDATGLIAGDRKNYLFKPSFFPYRFWQVKDNEEFRTREHYFLNQATQANSLLERSEARKRLAELYFGQGMMNETLGVLGSLRRDDNEFFREHKLAAMEGAAHLMNYRIPEATVSLSSTMLDKTEEGDLLRKTVAAASSSNSEPIPYMAYNETYIRQYPPALRKRLAIIAANQALTQRDFKTPPLIFASLEDDNMTSGIEDYVAFMRGKIAAEMGRTKEAIRIWQKLADDIDDRQFRARAEFALILLGLQEETITPEDALQKLDKLRIVWRGDDLERSILYVVGQLNVNIGHYWDGMKAWEELMQYYPNTQESADAYKRLAETFRMLYLDGGAKEMEPVKSLALYNEFQELTPIGKDGNKMVQFLIDQLVSVDLLDQAAARLKNLVEFRLKDEEKSRSGARLAVIYLLNREPEKAISALQTSRVDGVPATLSLERNRIAAQALIDLKHYDQALTMIEGDYSKEGEAVRLEAYTRKEDWAYAVDILENILRSRPDLKAPFSDEEGNQLVQLVLGYIFLGENDQLKYLREAYAPLMEKNKYKDEFLFFTQDTAAIKREEFDKFSQSLRNMQGFMDGYRKKLRDQGLSQAVGGEQPAPASGETAPQPPANPQ